MEALYGMEHNGSRGNSYSTVPIDIPHLMTTLRGKGAVEHGFILQNCVKTIIIVHSLYSVSLKSKYSYIAEKYEYLRSMIF